MAKALQTHWVQANKKLSILFGGGFNLGEVVEVYNNFPVKQYKATFHDGAHTAPQEKFTNTEKEGRDWVEQKHGILEF